MAMKAGELAPQVVTIEGVRGYADENGTVRLNVEDIARGLGFTQVKNGVEYVRMETVNRYLAEFGFPKKVGKEDYIPENMFYRLVWKSRDENALNFQSIVADKILPSIRKYGVYATDDFLSKTLADPDWAIGILTELKATREKNAALENQVAELKPKADYCELILQSEEALPVTVIAKDYGMGTVEFNKLLHKLEIQFRVGKQWVLYQIYAGLGYMKSVTTMLQNGLTVTQSYWTQKGRMFLYNVLKKANVLPLIEKESPMATLF